MKNYLKTALILGIICAVSSLLLAVVNSITAPVIEEHQREAQLDAYRAISAGYEIGEETMVDDSPSVTSFIPLTADGSTRGYILNLQTNGYGGKITFVASYLDDGTLLNAKVLSNSETPGLGKRCEDEGYMERFVTDHGIPRNKIQLSDEDAQAVSGATITFTGLATGLEAGSDYIREVLE